MPIRIEITMNENLSSNSISKSVHDKSVDRSLKTNQVEKLSYVAPELTRFGDVRDVTLSASSPVVEDTDSRSLL
jgi:hypothetical protein